MVLMYNQVIFPPNQANMVAKRYIEWLKDNPPDPTIEKTLCIGIRSTEDGNIVAIGISEAAKGKVAEALQLGTQQNLFLAAGIEGCKYKLEIMMDFKEGYKILGMAPPARSVTLFKF
ncbi:MAG: hypothetical protein EAX89_11550 [Candidatus Lokiarchaeota archaeon]|nr:hypothetical protein [Candidatus Lokiarchaeota archaeon]